MADQLTNRLAIERPIGLSVRSVRAVSMPSGWCSLGVVRKVTMPLVDDASLVTLTTVATKVLLAETCSTTLEI